MSKIVLFQAIQFSIITQFTSIWPIDRALSGATTPVQCRPESDGNEGVLHTPQSSSNTETSSWDNLVSYPGHLLGECLTPLQRSSRCILHPQPSGKVMKGIQFIFTFGFICRVSCLEEEIALVTCFLIRLDGYTRNWECCLSLSLCLFKFVVFWADSS